MAVPRVFVSSTYYDLKHLRASLEVFIGSLGYEAVLSEKGSIAYAPDQPLDESCYREVKNCDIYLLIIGGRYGSEASETRTSTPKSFFERYDSVTKMEYKSAIEDDVPIYILIERSVYAEFQTFQKNRGAQKIKYAHVDSVNIFHLIDGLLAQPFNNPIQTFEKYSDIESWLRLQWAGLFRELLRQRSGQKQLRGLAAQIQELSEVNKTLRRYLEEVIAKVAPKEAHDMIKAENTRLEEAQIVVELLKNPLVQHLVGEKSDSFDLIRKGLEQTHSLPAFIEFLTTRPEIHSKIARFVDNDRVLFDANVARKILGKPPFPVVSKKEA